MVQSNEPAPVLHDTALPSTCWLVGLLRFLNLGDHHLKRFGHIGVVARTRLDPAAAELFGEILSLLGGEFPLGFGYVALVSDNDDGNGLGALQGCISIDVARHKSGCTAPND